MDHGEIQQWDIAYNLYHKPANRFVANFIGEGFSFPEKCSTDSRWKLNWERWLGTYRIDSRRTAAMPGGKRGGCVDPPGRYRA
ncbi:hypothetical protein [Nitrosospira multiformis]|uniref:hypothetical protein n=1 Tax=Nitrosospira multiformis TaxID=1231 RepID=UPI00094256BF|nr:hypothetical protein [Nitrosospira multiformis]